MIPIPAGRLNLAASRASAEDQKEYADARDAVASVMTPQQIADAQQRATEWLAAFEQREGKEFSPDAQDNL